MGSSPPTLMPLHLAPGATTSKLQDLPAHGRAPCGSLQFAEKGRPDIPSLSWAHPLRLAGRFPYKASCCSADTMSALCARLCLPHSPKSGTKINPIGKGLEQACGVPVREE